MREARLKLNKLIQMLPKQIAVPVALGPSAPIASGAAGTRRELSKLKSLRS